MYPLNARETAELDRIRRSDSDYLEQEIAVIKLFEAARIRRETPGAEIVIDHARAVMLQLHATARARMIARFDAACAGELDILSDLRERVAVGDCRLSTLEALEALRDSMSGAGEPLVAERLSEITVLMKVPVASEVAS